MEAQILAASNGYKVFSSVNIGSASICLLLSLVLSATSAAAQTNAAPPPASTATSQATTKPDDKPAPPNPANCSQATSDKLIDMKCLGLGLAVGGFFFTAPDIVTTTVDPGTKNVRVTEEHQREASVWFEGHATLVDLKFFFPSLSGTMLGAVSAGPFAAVQLGGTAGTFSSFAAGGMIYFPTKLDADSHDLVSGFGLGIGYGWTQIHSLGDGVKEDQPLPANLTTVPMKQTDIGGLVIMISTTIPLGN